MMANSELHHVGVLGMRWGRRKSSSGSSTTKISAKKKIANDDSEDDIVPKKKSVKDMSDAELNAIVKRLETEKKYRELNPEKVSRGKQFVSDMITKAVIPGLQEASKQAVKSLVLKEVTKTMEKAAKK